MPASEDERGHVFRAQGTPWVPLCAPRIISVFYLKAVLCTHTHSWDGDDTVVVSLSSADPHNMDCA